MYCVFYIGRFASAASSNGEHGCNGGGKLSVYVDGCGCSGLYVLVFAVGCVCGIVVLVDGSNVIGLVCWCDCCVPYVFVTLVVGLLNAGGCIIGCCADVVELCVV